MTEAGALRLLAGGGMTGVWSVLQPQFEQTTGHTLDIFFGTTPNPHQGSNVGQMFDAGIVLADVMLDAPTRARFASGPTIDIARVGLGVVVRSGGPRPDIGTSETFKTTLPNARSIATVPESTTGYSVARASNHLSITEQMKAKIRARPSPVEVVAAVAKGEAELGMSSVRFHPTCKRTSCSGSPRHGDQGSQRGQGAARLSQEPRGCCDHQGEGDDSEIASLFVGCLAPATEAGVPRPFLAASCGA